MGWMRRIWLLPDLYRRAVFGLFRDDGFGYASQMAYHALFSIFPAVLVVMAILPYFGQPELVSTTMNLARPYLPASMMSAVEDTLEQVLQTHTARAFTVGTFLLIWAASNYLNIALKAAGAALRGSEMRHFVVRRLLALGLVVFFGFAMVASFSLFVFGESALRYAQARLGFGWSAAGALASARWILVVGLLTFSAASLYVIAPTPRLRWRSAMPGALTFTALWLFATGSFSTLIAHYGGVNWFHGAVEGVVLLLVWFYVTSLLLVFGAEVCAARLQRRHEIR